MRLQHGGEVDRYEIPLLDFSVNLNPLGMPPSVEQALHTAITACQRYPDPQCQKLRAAIAEREQCPIEWIVCGNGAADLLYRIPQVFRPQKALLPIPTFSEYAAAFAAAGCLVQTFPLLAQDGFQLRRTFLEAITADIDWCILCHPNNPTGRLIPQDLLEEILARCEAKQIGVLIDACFLEFTEGASLHRQLLQYPNLILLKAFTKTYNLAGVRLGYALTRNREWANALSQWGQPWSVSLPAQLAGIAAAGETAFLAKSRAFLAREREKLTAFLRDRGVSVFPSDANFLLLQSDLPLQEMLLRQGILIRDCRNFAGLGAGYYRIAVKGAAENVRFCRAWEAME